MFRKCICILRQAAEQDEVAGMAVTPVGLSGFVLYYKRLEAGTFHLPQDKQQATSLTYSELSLLLEGLVVEVKHRRKRYERSFEKV